MSASDFSRHVRYLLGEGLVNDYNKAGIVVSLAAFFDNLPLEEFIEASTNNNSFWEAAQYIRKKYKFNGPRGHVGDHFHNGITDTSTGEVDMASKETVCDFCSGSFNGSQMFAPLPGCCHNRCNICVIDLVEKVKKSGITSFYCSLCQLPSYVKFDNTLRNFLEFVCQELKNFVSKSDFGAVIDSVNWYCSMDKGVKWRFCGNCLAGNLTVIKGDISQCNNCLHKLCVHCGILSAEKHLQTCKRAMQILKIKFPELSEDDLMDSLNAGSLEEAILDLSKQPCPICFDKFAVEEMFDMWHCNHRCCKNCANHYFTNVVLTKPIRSLECFQCKTACYSERGEFDIALPKLKNLLSRKTFETLDNKMKSFSLENDDNFKYCPRPQCTDGVLFQDEHQMRFRCPTCNFLCCRKCDIPWEKQHENLSCEKFKEWKHNNDPSFQALGLENQLQGNDVNCPHCKTRFFLDRGGCMHFTCPHCKFEFCDFCQKGFFKGEKCPKGGVQCGKLGLHCHHARTCYAEFLRDEPVDLLQKLLKDHGVIFETAGTHKSCSVSVVSDDGKSETKCQEAAKNGFAGKCEKHYKEYLSKIIHKHKLDPIYIIEDKHLQAILLKAGHRNVNYTRDQLIKMIERDVPLSSTL